jgi:raffinose/stachyose/melibiose transport system substrate-binding protein
MLNRSKAFFSALSLILILATLLGACAPASTPTAAPAAPAAPAVQAPAPATAAPQPAAAKSTDAPAAPAAPVAEPVKLTMWFDTGGNADQAKCMVDNIVGNWNQKNPGIQMDGSLQANAWDATRTAVAGGGGPDIVYTPGPSFVFQMAKAGQLLALDDYAKQLNWDKQFLPWALDLGKVDGKLYSIPNEVETMVLYYNKTVFEKNGWKPPTTIDEYLKLNATIKKAGLIPNAAGNSDWKPADEHYWTIFVNHMAGPQKVYDALKGTAKWDDPEIVKALDTMNGLMMDGSFMGGLDRYYTTSSDEFLAAFGNGKAAMVPSGTWWMGTISKYFGKDANNSNDWDWVSFPTTDGKPLYTLGIGSTYSINAATKNPKEAAQFLTYYFSPEAQAVSIGKCGVAPAPINITADQLKGIDARRARLIAELNKAAGEGNYGYTTWTFWPPKSDEYIYSNIEKVWAKQMTVKDYLAGLQKLFDEEVKAGNVPPIPTR